MASTFATVSSLYKDILGREPDDEGLANWTSYIDGGHASVADVVSRFTSSGEALNGVNQIVQLYLSAFGRVPDAGGLQNWTDAYHGGLTIANIALGFTQSDEFAATAPSDDSGYIVSLYQNALGRQPEEAGLTSWLNALANGLTRDQALSGISGSAEGLSSVGAKAQVVLAFNGVLGQLPTTAELNAVIQSQGEQSLVELIKTTADDLIAGGDGVPDLPTDPEVPTVPSLPAEAIYTPHEGATGGSSDASTAIALDDKYMLVGDDESSILRVYDRSGGDAVLEWDYSKAIGTDAEIDLEAATLVGDILYITGSHSNTKKGVDADSREIIFAVKISGTGADTTFDYQGKFTGMEAALVAWDQSGASGHEAGYFGFAASSGAGLAPENINGFSIEGMTTSIDDSELYLGFRAPQMDTGTRDKALIVAVENYKDLISGEATTPVFGEAIELNLGGRGIRSIDKAADGSGYLIIAGPSGGATDEVTNDFRLYTWDGLSTSQPVELDNNLDALLAATGGSFESIVSPASILPGTQIQLLQDNGDTIWAGQTDVSKDLDPADQQFKGNVITLGQPVVDATAPVLVKASPADADTGVAVSGSLSLVFDEGVALGKGTIELQLADGTVVESFSANSTQLTVDYNKITLQPTHQLLASTDYKLVLSDEAVTDHSGNALDANTIDFTTGEKPHYDMLITEVNSNATGGDFFEIYNYGTSAIDLSGWKMTDEEAAFSTAVGLPTGLSLAAGETLVVASVAATKLDAFKAAWNLGSDVKVVSIDGPGLGKEDAVVLFDSNGNVATAFNYDATTVVASDGTQILQSLATNTFTDGAHAGAAYGSAATASAIWDGVSTSDPHYLGAVAGEHGAYSQAASVAAAGSPGTVEIELAGILTLPLDAIAA
jgi:methionine-rich copper-binding protein CopC